MKTQKRKRKKKEEKKKKKKKGVRAKNVLPARGKFKIKSTEPCERLRPPCDKKRLT
jgi:hypothetical protein